MNAALQFYSNYYFPAVMMDSLQQSRCSKYMKTKKNPDGFALKARAGILARFVLGNSIEGATKSESIQFGNALVMNLINSAKIGKFDKQFSEVTEDECRKQAPTVEALYQQAFAYFTDNGFIK